MDHETVSQTINVTQIKKPSEITFHPGGSKNAWVMRISSNEELKVEFNREGYPEWKLDNFYKAVCEIMFRSGFLDRIYTENKNENRS